MKKLLEDIAQRCSPLFTQGRVADYIPELARVEPSLFGLAVTDMKGHITVVGDETPCSMQSVVKVATLALALRECGEDTVFSAVGVNAIADPFNSIMRLEMDAPHRPHNPMINSGAIVVVSLLPHEGVEGKINAIIDMVRRLTANDSIDVMDRVYRSEKFTSDRNRALAYFLRSVGSFKGDIEDVLDVYFRMCSLGITARDLSVLGATLAADGCNPVTGEDILTPHVAQTVRAVMTTCGMYDGSGRFAVEVGIPAKSGVGGGVVASVPGKLGIGVVGPALDKRGNSVTGLAALKILSEEKELRVL